MADLTVTGPQQQDEAKAAQSQSSLAQLAMQPATGLILLALAVLQQCLGHHTADNVWLMELAEKYLAGERVYKDIIELNPPASMFIYLLPALVAKTIGLSSELVTSVFVFTGALASIGLATTIATTAGILRKSQSVLFINVCIFAVLFLPGITFAQREHVALIVIFPVLAIYAARAEANAIPLWQSVVAGLLAGCAVSIKPYFLLAMAFPFAIALWRQRRITLFFQIENILAAGVVLAYAAVVYLFFSDFLALTPVILDTYAQVRLPFTTLLLMMPFLLTLALLASGYMAAQIQRHSMFALCIGAAATGFTLAILLQGKGWINHFLPGVTFAMIALVLQLAPAVTKKNDEKNSGSVSAPLIQGAVLVLSMAFAPILFGVQNQYAMKEEYPGLQQAVRQIGPAKPRLAGLSAEMDLGYPLTRNVGGTWISQVPTMWQMAFPQLLLAKGLGNKAKLQGYIDQSAAMFARNVSERKPDIILVDQGPHIDKMRAHPAIAAALAAYKPTHKVSGITLWVPKSAAP